MRLRTLTARNINTKSPLADKMKLFELVTPATRDVCLQKKTAHRCDIIFRKYKIYTNYVARETRQKLYEINLQLPREKSSLNGIHY